MPRRTSKCGLGVLAVKAMVGLVMLASIFGLTGPVANAAPKPVPADAPGLTLPLDRWCGYYEPCWNHHQRPYRHYHFWYGWRWWDDGWYDHDGCGCWRP